MSKWLRTITICCVRRLFLQGVPLPVVHGVITLRNGWKSMGYNSTEFRAHLVETHGNEPPPTVLTFIPWSFGDGTKQSKHPQTKRIHEENHHHHQAVSKVHLNLNLRHWFPFNLCQFAFFFQQPKLWENFQHHIWRGHRSLSYLLMVQKSLTTTWDVENPWTSPK